MTVDELITLLEPHKGKSLPKGYSVEVLKNGKVTLKQNTATKPVTKAEYMARVVDKINTKEHNYNYKEFAYAFEYFCRQFGYTYTTRLKIDQVGIKKVFPNHKSFNRDDLVLVYTYIRIFEKQIKTSTYLSPTWGGMVFAMPRIKQALRAVSVREQKVQESELVDEVY